VQQSQQMQMQQQSQMQLNGGSSGTDSDNMTNIMFNEPGKPPRPLHSNEVVQMIQQLQSQVEYYTKYTADLEHKYTVLQNEHLDAMYTHLNIYNGTPSGVPIDVSRATLPINQLKGRTPTRSVPI
jgi:hypothetical protein